MLQKKITHRLLSHLLLQPCLPLDGLHDNGFPPSFKIYNDQLHGLVVCTQIAGLPIIQKMLAQSQDGGHSTTSLLDFTAEGLQHREGPIHEHLWGRVPSNTKHSASTIISKCNDVLSQEQSNKKGSGVTVRSEASYRYPTNANEFSYIPILFPSSLISLSKMLNPTLTLR